MSLTMVYMVLYLFRGKKINSEGICSRLLREQVTFRAPRGGGCEAGVGGKGPPPGFEGEAQWRAKMVLKFT